MLALTLVLAFIISLGESKLIDPSVIASLVVVEAPLTAFFYLIERRRSRTSESMDRIDVASKYKHLRIHRWMLGSKRFNLMEYYVIENTAKHIAYDCPSYLMDWGKEGMVEMVEHKNEKALREFFEAQEPPVKLLDKEARPIDLLP